MKILHSMIFISAFLSIVAENLIEVCDVEGSGIDDCSSETYCCQQSECDILYRRDNKIENPIDVEYDSESNNKCCDITQVKPMPSDCKLCTKCCDEVERKQIPLPSHCSKCHKCSHLSVSSNGNQSGKNTGVLTNGNQSGKKTSKLDFNLPCG